MHCQAELLSSSAIRRLVKRCGDGPITDIGDRFLIVEYLTVLANALDRAELERDGQLALFNSGYPPEIWVPAPSEAREEAPISAVLANSQGQ